MDLQIIYEPLGEEVVIQLSSDLPQSFWLIKAEEIVEKEE